jgi:protein SCO1/2
MKRAAAVAAAAAFGVIVGILVLPLVADEPHEFAGTVLSDPRPAPEFTLISDTGERVSLESFRGQVVLIYFGYTFCPDICPASLAELADATDLLGEEAGDVQVVMVSVDPARDTPEVLGEYMDYFDPSFVGLTGSESEIAAVADAYGVFYQAEEGTAATGYLVDHLSSVFVIDKDGDWVQIMSYGTTGEQIAADVREWL